MSETKGSAAERPGTEAIEQIKARHAAMIPGLYMWEMWDTGACHLRTAAAPGHIIMQFTRKGFNAALPMFNDRAHHFMRRADEYARQRYPHHVGYDLDIDHPDAQGLAHSWQDIDDLLREREALLAEIEQLKALTADNIPVPFEMAKTWVESTRYTPTPDHQRNVACIERLTAAEEALDAHLVAAIEARAGAAPGRTEEKP